MTAESHDDRQSGQPAALGCNDGLGLVPERDLVERLRAHVPAEARHGTTCAEDDILEAADEIERLRAALEVSQAASQAAVSKAQWQARTNAELNALQYEVRRFRAEACRRLNAQLGA